MVKNGEFREDLYYRLMIFQISLKRLRDNHNDLKIKIKEYFDLYKKLYKTPEKHLGIDLQKYLEKYEWRGNVRELKNCMESLVALSEKEEINCSELPIWMKHNESKAHVLPVSFSSNYGEAMEKFEEYYLRYMFEKHRGRVNETARQIKISKVNLINKAKKYHINTLKMRVHASEENELVAA